MEPRGSNDRPSGRQSYFDYRSGDSRRLVTPLRPQPQVQSTRPAQDPSSASTLQPVAPTQQQVQPNTAEVVQTGVNSLAPPVERNFEVPAEYGKKKRKFKLKIKLARKVKLGLVALLGASLFAGLTMVLISWQANRSDPVTILNEAISNHLQVNRIQIDSSEPGVVSKSVFDLSRPKDPIFTSSETVRRFGDNFGIKVYGSNEDSFITYTSFPGSISNKLADKYKDQSVQLKTARALPIDASRELSNLAEVKVRLFGPLLFGNFDDKTSQQISEFIASNNVYKLQTDKPKTIKLEDQKVLVMPVKIDVGYLKEAVQSAALSMGYAPDDIADAVRALDTYKSSVGDIYVSKSDHKILKFTITAKNGDQTNINYSGFDGVKISSQPNKSIPWQKFSADEWQIQSQVASKQPVASLDLYRKNSLDNLHNNLASYGAQKGYYPSLLAMNDLSWLSKITNGAPETQKDPLAISLVLSGAPVEKAYAYMPSPASCDNQKVVCAHYKLVSTMSNKTLYTVQDP